MLAVVWWMAAVAWAALAHEGGHVAAARLCGARAARLGFARGRRGIARWVASPCARIDWGAAPPGRWAERVVAAAGTAGCWAGCWALAAVRVLPPPLRGDLLALPALDLAVNWLAAPLAARIAGVATDGQRWRAAGGGGHV